MAKESSLRQYGFVAQGGSFVLEKEAQVSERVEKGEVLQELMSITKSLSKRKLWKEKSTRGRLLFLDTVSDQHLIIDQRDLSVIKNEPGLDFKQSLEQKTGLAGAIMKVDSLTEAKGQEFEKLLEKVSVNFQNYSSVLFVVEKKGEDKNRGWRKTALVGLGLVGPCNVVEWGKQGGYFLWEGRLPKKRETTERNYLETGPSWRIDWLKKQLEQIKEQYEARGLRVNQNEMIERLKHSTSYAIDSVKLKLGFGMSFEANCGCRWQRDIKGIEWQLNKCNDVDCPGILPAESKERVARPGIKELKFGLDVLYHPLEDHDLEGMERMKKIVQYVNRNKR